MLARPYGTRRAHEDTCWGARILAESERSVVASLTLVNGLIVSTKTPQKGS
jgi:hypothetical protein